MKCFHIFKDKSKGRVTRSAPELKEKAKTYSSSSSGINLLINSTCSQNSPRISELYEEKSPNLRVFTFSELKHATNDFSRSVKIGEGGFGCVYKGIIKPLDNNGEPMVAAVKKLKHDGLQGHKQWLAEVQFLGVVEHPSLVKLLGYCSVNAQKVNQRLLVYEFMPNKSLEDHLFNRAHPALAWKKRLEIMLGAAEGLAYLHEGLEVQVIYRDFKSSNVLLDENFKPKLSDFGLAREGPDAGQSHVSTAVVGTHGYACPDYIETGHLTTKSDVWSYGVVLYEMLTGRRSQEKNRPRTEQVLVEWVQNYPADSRKFIMIMDPRLENHYSLKAARRIAKLADSCLLKTARERPCMSEVVVILKQIIQISEEENSSGRIHELPADDSVHDEKQPRELGNSELWKRRMALLEKLGENVECSNRRFLFMQKTQVT